MTGAARSIERHDVGRDPRRLRLKYARMAADPFAFFRGSCHLFFERLPRRGPTRHAPGAWISGDLHLENFGSFEGGDGLACFDLTDFDEACLAPCTWDVVRFQASLILGAASIRVGRPRAKRLATRFAVHYADALAVGKAGRLERDTVEKGMIRDLLDEVRKRGWRRSLDARSLVRKGERSLLVDRQAQPSEDAKALPTSLSRARVVRRMLAASARSTAHPHRLRVLDAADRVAGLGSLGLDRYVVLTRGEGAPGRRYLLDVKEAPSSAPAARSPFAQPPWANDAERIVTCQRWLQAASPAFLSVAGPSRPRRGSRGYVLRELLPSEDRVKLSTGDGAGRRLDDVVRDMARLTAWAHLRASGRRGAASADDLEAFGRDRRWIRPLTRLALKAAAKAFDDHASFAKAWKRATMRLPAAWSSR